MTLDRSAALVLLLALASISCDLTKLNPSRAKQAQLQLQFLDNLPKLQTPQLQP